MHTSVPPYSVRTWLASHDAEAGAILATTGGRRGSVTRDATSIAPPLRTAPLAEALPRGRIDWRGSATHLQAVTVLSGLAFEVLCSTGSVQPDADVALDGEGDHFRAAYDWMRWQMLRTISGCSGGFPMWVWLRLPKSDLLEHFARAASCDPGAVLLALEIPRERVLVSAYGAWHDVLTGTPSPPWQCRVCHRDGCDDHLEEWFDGWFDEWDARIPRTAQGELEPWWRWPTPLRAELLRTWRVVLEPSDRCRAVQGTVERVDATWVRDAVILG